MGVALLLTQVGVPAVIEFADSAALAQDSDIEARAALFDTAPLSEFDINTLRRRMRLLRAAIRDGTFKGEERRHARTRIKAYRDELQTRLNAKPERQTVSEK